MVNGELQELYNDIDKRITTLEVKVEERWKNHNDLSSTRHTENCDKFDQVFVKLSDLDCKVHTEKLAFMKADIKLMWWVIIVVVVGGVVFGIWLKV